VQITAGGQKFASESDFNRPKKNHSRCFSTFWVSTQPRSSARRLANRIFFVNREGRGINFVEHGGHLPDYTEGAAGDKDLIARLK
jgi:hypothetical protein